MTTGVTLSLVLDIGESNIRMGYAGYGKPKIQISSVFAKKIHNSGLFNESFGDSENINHIQQIPGKSKSLFGDVLLTDRPFYEYKKIFNINKENEAENNLSIFSEMYVDELCPGMSLDPKSYPLVIIEPSKTDEKFRKSVTEMVMKSGIPRVFLIKKASANLYACGRSNGIVIESGGRSTKVTPVEDGYVLHNCHNISRFGGEVITSWIMKNLNSDEQYFPEGLNLQAEREDYDESFFEYLKFNKAKKIKHRLLTLEEEKE